jgi:hypothetical protein
MPMRIYHLVEAESLWALSQRGIVNLPQVKELQDRLRAAGFDPGPSDGWYGQRTANAVRAYQQANNLAVDGDAGPQTLGSLGMAGAQQTPAQPTPPAETPPAPAPRQPAREPEPTPAPAPTRREPASTPAPAPTRREPDPDQPTTSSAIPYSNLRVQGGRIYLPAELNPRTLRDTFNRVSEISLSVKTAGRLGNTFRLHLIANDFDRDDYDYDTARSVGRNIVNFLRQKLASETDLDLSVIILDKNENALGSVSDIIIDGEPNRQSPSTSEPEASTAPAPTRREPENDQRATVDWNRYADTIRRQVTEDLLDAESARFRNVEIRRMTEDGNAGLGNGDYFVIGEINGKNRMGAYVGYRIFYSLDINFLSNGNLFVLGTQIEGGDSNRREVIRSMATRARDLSERVATLRL